MVVGNLHDAQQHDLHTLLHDFDALFQNKPGRTEAATHYIKMGDATPIRLAPYRLPATYRDVVALELQEVESQGIIEHSSSQWAVPIVLVPKDKAIRICVDYRHLNTVSQPDAYPMPRIDDLLDRVGQSTFIPSWT